MKDHHDELSDEDLILYHYGESPDPETITATLARSVEAQTRYAELRALLAAADEWAPPELPASFGDDVWQRLQPRLAAERVAALAPTEAAPAATAPTPTAGAPRASDLDTPPAVPTIAPSSSRGAQRRSDLDLATPRAQRPSNVLAAAHRFAARTRRFLPAAAAAVLLLAVGYLAGRLATDRQPARPPTLSADARQRLLAETLAEHLERSQRLFTELANSSPEETAALGGEQRAAQELLSANRLYRTAAERGGREGVAALLDEMEPVLVELSHLPAEPEPADLEFLRRRIDAQGLLFKTRIASELLTRSLRPDSVTPPTRSTV
ncbi:MAG TPA: hypothetical protein VFS60_18595 [Thermoanaerobaculia bacterium]|nr:hypothetical protein [Thermoanaerobaculia bacterium]